MVTLGEEKVAAKGEIPTLPCGKWETRARFSARTDTGPDMNCFCQEQWP